MGDQVCDKENAPPRGPNRIHTTENPAQIPAPLPLSARAGAATLTPTLRTYAAVLQNQPIQLLPTGGFLNTSHWGTWDNFMLSPG